MKNIIAMTMCSLVLLIGCKSENRNNQLNGRQPANVLQNSPPTQVISNQQRDALVNNEQITYKIENPVVSVSSYANISDDLVLAPVSSERTLLTYKMSGVNGKETTATTLVFVPKGTVPKEGWSTVVWAHGTTGVADKCAPSKQGLKGTEVFIAMLLAAGYVVVAPDYEGLGSPGNHPYLNLKSEAYSITDAVVAKHTYLTRNGGKLSKKWLSIGHSQGGHAVLGAAQYASRANLDYKGTIAIAPASNLEKILIDKTKLAQGQLPVMQIPIYASLDSFTSLIAAGTQGHHNTISYGEIFKSHLADVAPIAERECVAEIMAEMSSKMTQHATLNLNSLAGYGRLQDNFFKNLKIRQFIDKDLQPLTVKVDTPIILYHGGVDTIIPIAATDLLYANATKLGTRVSYKKSMIWDHFTVYTNNHLVFLQDVKTLMPIQ